MDFNYLRTSFLLITLILVSGCATYVERSLLQRIPPSEIGGVTPDTLLEEGIETREFCLSVRTECTKYLFAAASGSAEKNEIALKFTVTFTNGTKVYELDLDREQVPYTERGTVVLAHGYGADKQMWKMMINYLTFLGFNVIAPDLQGHGESTIDQPSFGYHDAEVISALIDSLPAKDMPRPLIATGVSMGGVTASRLANIRDDVAGLLLYAPMAEFDEATIGFIRMFTPKVSRFLPESSVRTAVQDALTARSVPEGGASVVTYLDEIEVPTLIIVGDKDPIAPIDAYQPIAERNSNIQLQQLLKRHHIEITAIDEFSHEIIWPWLEQLGPYKTID